MLTAADREILNDYVQALEELRQTTLGKAGFHISYEVTVAAGTASGTGTIPDEAALTEFLMRFRPIWSDDERSGFTKVCQVLYLQGDLEEAEVKELHEIRAAWKDAGRQSPIRVDDLRPRRFIEMYFYSDKYFHRGEPEERAKREAVEAVIGRDFARTLFIDPVIEFTRAAVDLGQLVVRVLAR
jgi:hypothetical protein